MAEGFGNEAGLAGHEQHSARRGEERITRGETSNSKLQTPIKLQLPNPNPLRPGVGGGRLIPKLLWLLWPAATFSISFSLEAAEPRPKSIATNSVGTTNIVSAATVSEVEKEYAKLQALDDAAQAE